jgi:hypothetical protein
VSNSLPISCNDCSLALRRKFGFCTGVISAGGFGDGAVNFSSASFCEGNRRDDNIGDNRPPRSESVFLELRRPDAAGELKSWALVVVADDAATVLDLEELLSSKPPGSQNDTVRFLLGEVNLASRGLATELTGSVVVC